ncbi:MAG: hypothetical protein WCG16_13685 [Methylococcales bacterium]
MGQSSGTRFDEDTVEVLSQSSGTRFDEDTVEALSQDHHDHQSRCQQGIFKFNPSIHGVLVKF